MLMGLEITFLITIVDTGFNELNNTGVVIGAVDPFLLGKDSVFKLWFGIWTV
jgi:hypothetical protein